MLTPHPWFECPTALIWLGGIKPEENEQGISETDLLRWWAKVPDSDKHRFHKFCCEEDHSAPTLAVIYRLRLDVISRMRASGPKS